MDPKYPLTLPLSSRSTGPELKSDEFSVGNWLVIELKSKLCLKPLKKLLHITGTQVTTGVRTPIIPHFRTPLRTGAGAVCPLAPNHAVSHLQSAELTQFAVYPPALRLRAKRNGRGGADGRPGSRWRRMSGEKPPVSGCHGVL